MLRHYINEWTRMQNKLNQNLWSKLYSPREINHNVHKYSAGAMISVTKNITVNESPIPCINDAYVISGQPNVRARAHTQIIIKI